MYDRMSLSNKVALITGGSAGIGASIAILFSQQGANVAIVGRNETKLQDVAEKCNIKPLIIQADVSNDEDAKRIIEKTIEKFGKIDILINNAGITRQCNIEDNNIIQFYDEIMNTNLRAAINITNLAVQYLINTKGNIVFISSVAANVVSPATILYSVSKAALSHFSRNIAKQLASKGVRVNTVSPGPVRTDILTTAKCDITWEFYKNMTQLGKISEPEEIAEMVLFLASDKGRSATGADFVIDNGRML